MKKLNYAKHSIKFLAPDELEFESGFHKTLYELVFNRIVDGGEYAPIVDVDEIFDESLGIDLPAVAEAADIKLKKKPSKKATNRSRLTVQFYVRQFCEAFPAMLGLFQNLVGQSDLAIKNAEILIGKECDGSNFILVKQVIDDLNAQVWKRELDKSETQSGVSTLGSISEELLSRVFESMLDEHNFFKVAASQVKSYGDFVLMCLPNNLWISVKSNFARERLLASGYSNDILGVGFFQDYEEFTSQVRVRNFQRAGFLAMYCPDVAVSPKQVEEDTNTYKQVCDFYEKKGSILPLNINGKPLIRPLTSLRDDLQKLLDVKDVQRRFTVDF